MSKFTELQILKAEERTMMGILSRMNDQLNRLKVEELALMSKIRTSEEESSVSTTSTPAAPATTSVYTPAAPSKPSPSQPLVESPWLASAKVLPALDLGIIRQRGRETVEEEDDEDDDDNDDEDEMDTDEEPESAHDQLTAFLKQLQSNS